MNRHITDEESILEKSAAFLANVLTRQRPPKDLPSPRSQGLLRMSSEWVCLEHVTFLRAAATTCKRSLRSGLLIADVPS